MFRIMSNKYYRRTLRKARDDGYEDGEAAARKNLEIEIKAAQEGWDRLHKAQELLEKRSKDRIIEALKDKINELIEEEASDLAYDVECDAEREINEAKSKAVSQT